MPFVALRHMPDAQFFFFLHFKRHAEQNLEQPAAPRQQA
jgi:hypothetical protein